MDSEAMQFMKNYYYIKIFIPIVNNQYSLNEFPLSTDLKPLLDASKLSI